MKNMNYNNFMNDENLKVEIPTPENNQQTKVIGKILFQDKEYKGEFEVVFGVDEMGEYYTIDGVTLDDDTPLIDYLRKQYCLNEE